MHFLRQPPSLTSFCFTKGAKVKVTRWFPGVLQDVVEEVQSKLSTTNVKTGAGSKSVKDLLALEADKTLESKRNKQIAATEEKTLDQIKAEMGIPLDDTPKGDSTPSPAAAGNTDASKGPRRRRVRQKMRSTPVVGGSLFDEPQAPAAPEPAAGVGQTGPGRHKQLRAFTGSMSSQAAELVIGGEVFKIRVLPETIARLRAGYEGELLEDSHVKFNSKDVPIEHRLSGFIRHPGLQIVSEEVSEHVLNETSDRKPQAETDSV